MAKKSNVKLIRNSPQVIRAIEDVAAQRMAAATMAVRNQVLETLSGSRTGRRYRVPGTNRTYTASAPGEPPAVQLGDLRRSIGTRIITVGKELQGQVGSPLDKAAMLEHGTKHMQPRPWLRPSFQAALDTVKEILSRRWF